jgi:HD-GYP domain-containing protein (c-di-GMP phosphodiesterase class II)
MGALSFHPRRLFQGADLKVMLLARRMMLNHRQQAHTYEKLKDSLFGLVRCLTAAIDAKDPYTWGHSERVARMAVRLGQQMAMPVAFLSDLYLAGLLHDIGKIGIRDSVLLKADKLTDEEFDHIKEHPLIGDRLVSNVKTLQNLRPGVRNHHERFDGRGYPDRLAGEDIPMQARVLAVADACDAMMAARPYRPALSPQRIDTIMTEGAGTQWDPQIIEHFQACRHELYSICQRGIGESVAVAVERALRSSGSNDEFTSRRGGGERLRGS